MLNNLHIFIDLNFVFEKQGVGFRLVDAAQTTVSQVVTEVTGAKPNTVDRETPEV